MHRADGPADQDPRWRAVVARDAAPTARSSIPCARPASIAGPPARRGGPSPRTCRFHATCEEAERAGFRPCKRCKPDEPGLAEQHAAKVAEICRFIEAAEQVPTLDELARKRAGMSPYHFHRVFKAVTGVTPKAYARGERAKRVRDELGRPSQTVTEAIYGAGFNSNGRFYETSDEVLGMKPTEYRAGGANTAIRFAIGECSLGSILVARSERGVCAILLGDEPGTLAARAPGPLSEGPADRRRCGVREAGRQGGRLRRGARARLDLPLDVRGTAFQQRVWQALRQIPAGKTASYAEIAATDRRAESGARGGAGVRGQRDRGGDPLPSRGAQRRRAVRLSLGRRAQAGAAGAEKAA